MGIPGLAGIGLALVLILAGCAETPRSEKNVDAALSDMRLAKDRTVKTIRDHRIDGWRYVDRHHVILTAGLKQDYLISFMSPCLGLNTAFAIGFTSTAGGVTKFDKIVVEGPGGTVETCYIREIVRLQNEP